jgi:hypothetical protein
MEAIITVDIHFHDQAALRHAGILQPLPEVAKVMRGAVPTTGDVIRFRGLNYESGELAFFLVSSCAHLLGGEGEHRIQLSLSLRVLHQP